MTLYMETTKISTESTIGEISKLLRKSGATAILQEYDRETGNPTSVQFKMRIGDRELPFALPARSEAIFNYFQKRRPYYNRESNLERDRDQSERVAWRQILRWIEAQLALMETGMVKFEEIFMPYMQVGPNETLYQRIASQGFQLALPPPDEKVQTLRAEIV